MITIAAACGGQESDVVSASANGGAEPGKIDTSSSAPASDTAPWTWGPEGLGHLRWGASLADARPVLEQHFGRMRPDHREAHTDVCGVERPAETFLVSSDGRASLFFEDDEGFSAYLVDPEDFMNEFGHTSAQGLLDAYPGSELTSYRGYGPLLVYTPDPVAHEALIVHLTTESPHGMVTESVIGKAPWRGPQCSA